MSISNYQVSARKYRPKSFDAVVGQEHIVSTLKNAIKQHAIAHAYLFSGMRGVGKTTCARIFAQAINCENAAQNDGEPCGHCGSCQSYAQQSNFNIIELDAASNNSVENIREWISEARVAPIGGKYKVYILDEAHMLSVQAFNAFLKTLEEPPSHAIFILATTEKHKLPPTILSRCQLMDFVAVEPERIQETLKKICEQEGIAYDEEVLFIIAEKGDGSLRDALSIFDKVVAFSNKNLRITEVQKLLQVLDDHFFLDNVECFIKKDTAGALLLFDKVYREGFSPHEILNGFGRTFRNLLVAKEPTTQSLLSVYPSLREKYLALANRLGFDYLVSALSVLHNATNNIRFADNKRYFVEFVLIQLSQLSDAVSYSTEEGGSPKPLTHSLAMPVKVRAKKRHTNHRPNPAQPSGADHAQTLYIQQDPPPAEKKKASLADDDTNELPAIGALGNTATGGKKDILSIIRQRAIQKIKSQQDGQVKVQIDIDPEELRASFFSMVSAKFSDAVKETMRNATFVIDKEANILRITLLTHIDKLSFDQDIVQTLHDYIVEKYGHELHIQSEFVPSEVQDQQVPRLSEEKILQSLAVSHPYLHDFIKKFNAEIIL